MIKNLGLFLLFGVSLFGCAAAKAPYAETEKMTHRIEYKVGNATMVCSGTALNAHVVLTAAHCMPEKDELITVSIGGREAKILDYARDGRDHVMLKVDIAFERAARFSKASLRKGDEIHYFGNPVQETQLLRRGYVSGPKADGNMIVDANAWGGDSGAGVFNDRGELVGVMSAIFGEHVFKLGVIFPIAFTAEQYKDFGVP